MTSLVPPRCEILSPLNYYMMAFFGVMMMAGLLQYNFPIFKAIHADLSDGAKKKAVTSVINFWARVLIFSLSVPLLPHIGFQAGLNFTDCGSLQQVVCIRLMFVSRYLLAAFFVWELVTAEGLGFNDWLHHGMTIAVALLTTDSRLVDIVRGDSADGFYDGFMVLCTFGAGTTLVNGMMVIIYRHCRQGDYAAQAFWISCIFWTHLTLSVCFFAALPLIYLVAWTVSGNMTILESLWLWFGLLVLIGSEAVYSWQLWGIKQHRQGQAQSAESIKFDDESSSSQMDA